MPRACGTKWIIDSLEMMWRPLIFPWSATPNAWLPAPPPHSTPVMTAAERVDRNGACFRADRVADYSHMHSRKPPTVDSEQLRVAGERPERFRVGAGHPGLQPQAQDFVVERGATRLIKVGCDFIEQHNGRHAVAALAGEFGVCQHKSDQQRFLFTGRTKARRHLLGSVINREIGSVWPCQRAASGAIAFAGARQLTCVNFFHVHGGAAAELAFKRPRKRQPSPREWAVRRACAAMRDGSGELADGFKTRRGDGHAGFSHDTLKALKARALDDTIGEQPVATLHGALKMANARSIAWIKTQNETI
jgi:hypothetical protein